MDTPFIPWYLEEQVQVLIFSLSTILAQIAAMARIIAVHATMVVGQVLMQSSVRNLLGPVQKSDR